MFKSSVESPVDGIIESISDTTGRVVVREAPVPVEIDAYVQGQIEEIIPEEGIVLTSNAAFIQGIFGIAGEKRGKIKILVSNPEDEITEEMISADLKGKIVVGGSFISLAAYKKAINLKVAGVVVGGFNYFDLKAVLGYNLGVAITGTEDLATALIVTEGYGSIPMSNATFSLLQTYDGQEASVNGATQIRAGVIRPEIVIPLSEDSSNLSDVNKEPEGIKEGSLVRVIRAPYFGRLGTVSSLPSELHKMESETMVRVANILLKKTKDLKEEEILIPRANLEMVELE